MPGIETALGVGLSDSEIREVSEYLAGGEYWADHHPAVSAPFDRPDKPKTSQDKTTARHGKCYRVRDGSSFDADLCSVSEGDSPNLLR